MSARHRPHRTFLNQHLSFSTSCANVPLLSLCLYRLNPPNEARGFLSPSLHILNSSTCRMAESSPYASRYYRITWAYPTLRPCLSPSTLHAFSRCEWRGCPPWYAPLVGIGHILLLIGPFPNPGYWMDDSDWCSSVSWRHWAGRPSTSSQDMCNGSNVEDETTGVSFYLVDRRMMMGSLRWGNATCAHIIAWCPPD